MEEVGASAANSSPLTPLSFLERAATVYGDCVSLVYKDHLSFTWLETHSRCLRLASALSTHFSLCPGDVVAVVSPNTPAIYEMHFAVPMAGAVLCTLNTRLDARTLSVQILHSSAKIVFADHEYLPLVRAALSLLADDRLLLLPILEHQSPDALTYEGLVAQGDPNFRWLRPKSEWAPMVLNYTSGTTSAPKGIVHSHRACYISSLDLLVEWTVPKQPVYLWTLPMFHANGWSFTWAMAAVGAANVCLRRFDAATLRSAIRLHNITHLCAAPVVLSMLVDAHPSPLAHCVHVLTGGSTPPPALLRRAESLGLAVTHVYGLTETGVAVTCEWKRAWDVGCGAEERARLKSRQGVRTLALDAADVVDPATGEGVPRDGLTTGEVVLRGPTVMLGYLKDPEASDRCIGPGGWFYTGDVGVMHPDGYLEIKGRSKDVIISGGENISGVEVESVLCDHPAVSEAAVVARPDDKWGESPCAFVVVKEEETTEEALIAYCRERLPHFMAPKTVVFEEELPKTATGKVLKYPLRERAMSMHGN